MEDKINSLAEEIEKNNIKACFGIPGSGLTLSLIDVLEKKGIPFYLNQFEGSGSLMASTFGKVNNSVGLSLSIKGPGLANSVPGIAASWFESFPLIHLTESHNYASSFSFSHKRINQRKLLSELTKGSFFLNNNKNDFNNIIDISKSETPGPVIIEMSSKSKKNNFKIKKNYELPVDDGVAFKLIKKSNTPIVILGSLACRKVPKNLLQNLMIPVFTTVAAKGFINEYKNNSAGIYTGVGLELTPEIEILKHTDLVIGIGLCAKEVLSVKKFSCSSINLESIYTKGIEGFKFNARISIDNFNQVFNLISDKNWGLDILSKSLLKLNNYLEKDFLPGYIFKILNESFVKQPRVVFDTGYFCTIAEHAWKSKDENLCLMSSNGRYMGTSIPMAIGASLANPSVPVIAFIGDGGIGMYVSEIKIAIDNNLPILFILLSDGGFGSIRTRALKDGLTQKPLIINSSTWLNIFKAFGINGEKCGSVNSLQLAIKNWKKNYNPLFIEINFSPSKYQKMVNGIR